MALSGVTNFKLDRDALITHVYRVILGVLATGQAPTPNEITDASTSLNMMLKAWQSDGLQLWVIKEAVLIPERLKQVYRLGLAGDHCSQDMRKTKLTAASAPLDSSIIVDSTADMVANDNVGIFMDNGDFHWTTISSIADINTFAIASPLPFAAAVDNTVYNYTKKIDRPHELLEMYRRNYDDVIDVPIIQLSRTDFFTLSDKDSEGVPVNYYYDPQLENSQLYIWQTASALFAQNNVLNLLIKKPFDDLNDTDNDFEFPQEWFESIAYGLAVRLAPSVGLPIKDRIILKNEAAQMKEDAMAFDNEGTSVFFEPNFR